MKGNDGIYISKCVSCVYLNKQAQKDLPVVCPMFNMPCFMLRPEKIRACYAKHGSKNISGAREPMDGEYMDRTAVAGMERAFNELSADQKSALISRKIKF